MVISQPLLEIVAQLPLVICSVKMDGFQLPLPIRVTSHSQVVLQMKFSILAKGIPL